MTVSLFNGQLKYQLYAVFSFFCTVKAAFIDFFFFFFATRGQQNELNTTPTYFHLLRFFFKLNMLGSSCLKTSIGH